MHINTYTWIKKIRNVTSTLYRLTGQFENSCLAKKFNLIVASKAIFWKKGFNTQTVAKFRSDYIFSCPKRTCYVFITSSRSENLFPKHARHPPLRIKWSCPKHGWHSTGEKQPLFIIIFMTYINTSSWRLSSKALKCTRMGNLNSGDEYITKKQMNYMK